MKNKEKKILPIISLIIGALVMAYLIKFIILYLQSGPTTSAGFIHFILFLAFALIFHPFNPSVIINGIIAFSTMSWNNRIDNKYKKKPKCHKYSYFSFSFYCLLFWS